MKPICSIVKHLGRYFKCPCCRGSIKYTKTCGGKRAGKSAARQKAKRDILNEQK